MNCERETENLCLRFSKNVMESAFFRTSEKPGGENVCHEIGLNRKTLSVKDEVWEQGEDKDGDDQKGDDDQGVEERPFKFEVHVI